MSSNVRAARGKLTASMLIFGTIGLFVRWIPLPSASIAFARALIGALFLAAVQLIRHQPFAWADIRRNIVRLLISGVLMGFNWILLFESYRYTTVAVATLCYYLAPVFVLMAAPLLLHEHWTRRKTLCIAAALAGMVLVSGVLQGGSGGAAQYRGILLAIGAAVLYAGVILLNKRMHGISPVDVTFVQLIVAGATVLPYACISGWGMCDLRGALLLAVVGMVHTGFAYHMYFSSVQALDAHTVSILSYLDPISAVLLSAIFLHEPLTVRTIAGGILIIGAAILSVRKSD